MLKSCGLDKIIIFKVSRRHSKTDDFALENNSRFTPLLKLKNPLTKTKGQDIFALISYEYKLKRLKEKEKLHMPDTSVDDLQSCSVVQLSWRQSNLVQQDMGFYVLPCAVGIDGTTVNKYKKEIRILRLENSEH